MADLRDELVRYERSGPDEDLGRYERGGRSPFRDSW